MKTFYEALVITGVVVLLFVVGMLIIILFS